MTTACYLLTVVRPRDWLRSAVKRAADRLGAKVREQPLLAATRALLGDLERLSPGIPERALARVALRASGAISSSLHVAEGRLTLQAELNDGRWVSARIVPLEPRFASRGAKELVFRVEPPEAAGDPVVREVVGAVAACVARLVWGAALRTSIAEEPENAFVERDGDVLFVDLRTIPSVRAALSSPLGATLTEAVGIERLDCRDGVLHAVLALPSW